MNMILASIGVFLVVVILLVVILLVAKNFLVPSGNVKLTINGDKELDVASGSTLLNTLSVNGVFLSSACGGKGSCGQCKCQVMEGGGEILPSETPHFSRKQIQDHWRLGCQVKVKGDMAIKVPESVLGVKSGSARLSPTRMWLRSSKSSSLHCPKASTWISFRVLMRRLRFLNIRWIMIRTLTRALSVMSICLHGRNSVCWA